MQAQTTIQRQSQQQSTDQVYDLMSESKESPMSFADPFSIGRGTPFRYYQPSSSEPNWGGPTRPKRKQRRGKRTNIWSFDIAEIEDIAKIFPY